MIALCCGLLGVQASLVAQMVKNPPGKESTCIIGDPGSILGSGRSPEEGNGNPLQYSCLENPTDRGAGRLQSMGHKESDTTEWLST